MPYVKKGAYLSGDPEKREAQLQNLVQNRMRRAKRGEFLPGPLNNPDYENDIIKFLEEQFFIPETKRPIVLEPFQKEKILKPLFYEDRPYTMALIGEPKKSGKSCLASGIANWYLFTQGIRPGENVEVLICASDKEQASWTVFNKLVKAIEMNRRMLMQCNITYDHIEVPHRGSVVRVLATDVSGAGMNADLVIFDELYLYRYEGMRDFFEVMTTVPTKPHPLILIVTTAGYEEDTDDLLFSLYSKGMDLKVKPDSSFYFFWDDGPEANRMPWQTKKYLDQQRGRLREATFLRFHYNIWSSNKEIFISKKDIEACIDPGLRPALPDKKLRIIVAVDVGLKHDSTGIVSVTKELNKIRLVNSKKFQGRPGKEVDLEEQVEDYIIKLNNDFNLVEVRYDPYQFKRSAQTLEKEGIKMVEYPQTLDRLTAMSQNLYDLIKGKNLILFNDYDLKKHLLNAQAKESTRGWRIVKKETSKKIDLAISLAMASQGAVELKERKQASVYVGDDDSDDDFDLDSWWEDRYRIPKKEEKKDKKQAEIIIE
ncbi:hypothetical protein ES702_00319 [subsurface metagenome]